MQIVGIVEGVESKNVLLYALNFAGKIAGNVIYSDYICIETNYL